MNAQELTLNIAVNLGRIGRWACEGRRARLEQFMKETEKFIAALDKAPKSKKFQRTFDLFLNTFNDHRKNVRMDPIWAETMFTWANILTHRARLA
ncbi:MAG: hypothetical protein NTY34_09310 [Candidatus Omnitrophica bacterium]|nr:hypothetical protein [Candidatus Omnitrophota bacterium]